MHVTFLFVYFCQHCFVLDTCNLYSLDLFILHDKHRLILPVSFCLITVHVLIMYYIYVWMFIMYIQLETIYWLKWLHVQFWASIQGCCPLLFMRNNRRWSECNMSCKHHIFLPLAFKKVYLKTRKILNFIIFYVQAVVMVWTTKLCTQENRTIFITMKM